MGVVVAARMNEILAAQVETPVEEEVITEDAPVVGGDDLEEPEVEEVVSKDAPEDAPVVGGDDLEELEDEDLDLLGALTGVQPNYKDLDLPENEKQVVVQPVAEEIVTDEAPADEIVEGAEEVTSEDAPVVIPVIGGDDEEELEDEEVLDDEEVIDNNIPVITDGEVESEIPVIPDEEVESEIPVITDEEAESEIPVITDEEEVLEEVPAVVEKTKKPSFFDIFRKPKKKNKELDNVDDEVVDTASKGMLKVKSSRKSNLIKHAPTALAVVAAVGFGFAKNVALTAAFTAGAVVWEGLHAVQNLCKQGAVSWKIRKALKAVNGYKLEISDAGPMLIDEDLAEISNEADIASINEALKDKLEDELADCTDLKSIYERAGVKAPVSIQSRLGIDTTYIDEDEDYVEIVDDKEVKTPEAVGSESGVDLELIRQLTDEKNAKKSHSNDSLDYIANVVANENATYEDIANAVQTIAAKDNGVLFTDDDLEYILYQVNTTGNHDASIEVFMNYVKDNGLTVKEEKGGPRL